MGPANNVTDSFGLKDTLRLCDNFIGRFSDKKATPTVRMRYFLWDFLAAPIKLKQSNKNFHHNRQSQSGKIFWDTGKFIL
jgi:hypothetical protein